MAIKGLNEIRRNFKRAQQKVDLNKRQALTRIGFIVKADAVRNAPVDTGNLRNSAYSEVMEDSVQVGFTADYAIFVHENLEAHFNRGGPKFLERAIAKNRDRILDELRRGGLV